MGLQNGQLFQYLLSMYTVYCICILIDKVGSERTEISTLGIHERASLLRHAHTFTNKNDHKCTCMERIYMLYIYIDVIMIHNVSKLSRTILIYPDSIG